MTTSVKYFTTEYVQETFQIFNDIFNKEGMLTNLLTQRRKKRYDHSGKSQLFIMLHPFQHGSHFDKGIYSINLGAWKKLLEEVAFNKRPVKIGGKTHLRLSSSEISPIHLLVSFFSFLLYCVILHKRLHCSSNIMGDKWKIS